MLAQCQKMRYNKDMQLDFSTRMNGLNGNATREIFKLLTRPEIVSFAGGLPSNECLPIEEIAEISNTLLKSKHATRILQYGTTEGFVDLKEALLTHVKGVGITNQTLDNCLVISGGQQGLYLALSSFIDKGDVVLVENPTYLAVLPMIQGFEGKAVGVNATENGLDLADLEEKIIKHKPKMLYVVPTFSNPTGKTYSVENRKKIAELSAKYNVIVIEDDPYSALRFEGNALVSIKSFDTIGNIIYISSFSKTLAPGLRVGVAIGDAHIIRKMVILKQSADLHTSNLSQAIVLECLKQNLIAKSVKKSMPIYLQRKNAMVAAIQAYMPKSFKFTNPEGGLFIWGEFEKGVDTVALFKEAIDKNVAYIQGQVFFAENVHKQVDALAYKNTIRLNYSTETPSSITSGIQNLSKIFS